MQDAKERRQPILLKQRRLLSGGDDDGIARYAEQHTARGWRSSSDRKQPDGLATE